RALRPPRRGHGPQAPAPAREGGQGGRQGRAQGGARPPAPPQGRGGRGEAAQDQKGRRPARRRPAERRLGPLPVAGLGGRQVGAGDGEALRR
ncbi:hypothetical protein BN1708_020458, partial [Verticillium longisporum]